MLSPSTCQGADGVGLQNTSEVFAGPHFAASAVIFGILLTLSPPSLAANPDQADFFETRIRPLLAKNCFACHTDSQMGGLRLDSRESLLKGGNSGPAIQPGKPAESLLIQAVNYTNERLKMPMAGEKLPDEEIKALARWVKEGAVWPETAPVTGSVEPGKYVIRPESREFWSFQPVSKPPLPTVKDSNWPKGAVDYFVLTKLEQKGLRPAKPADKRTLIRRATFDLIGLPPTPEEVEAFLVDDSAEAFARVVDRLLSSPHYGERWGRYWLDLARYSDGKVGRRQDVPYPNAYRYRDWVIQAFNNDLPYDAFVRAQFAADLLSQKDRAEMLPALGFFALGPIEDDRVDVTGRTFLALALGCARCHDHKFDPIPTVDYYSFQGIFNSSEYHEYPLAPEEVVTAFKDAQKQITEKKDTIDTFTKKQTEQLAEILLEQTSKYMVTAWQIITGVKADPAAAAQQESLDQEILERWVKYLRDTEKDHTYLKSWDDMIERGGTLEEAEELADDFQQLALAVNAEKKAIDDRNYVKLGGAEGTKETETRQFTNLEFLDLEKYYLWRDLASGPYAQESVKFDGGVFYFGGKEIDRFLSGEWKQHLDGMRADLAALEESQPPPYPFIHGYRDAEKPEDVHVAIRGDKDNLGEIAPRRFLQILSDGANKPVTEGSGRLDLANAITSPENPLTARVMVNRIWMYHFGEGIVRTPSNFGQLGERPTHPELLDYLASRFMESGWSIKTLHREMMLSAVYAMSTEHIAKNFEKDPNNRFLWRTNLAVRLDAEALRDAILAVSGSLDPSMGGEPVPLDRNNRRRTVYSVVARTKPNPTLTLFDFPDPKHTNERRIATVGPLQRLYFLNNDFVMSQADTLAQRLAGELDDDAARIERAYEVLYSRPPTESEVNAGLVFLRQKPEQWPRYAQVLLASSEFSSLN